MQRPNFLSLWHIEICHWLNEIIREFWTISIFHEETRSIALEIRHIEICVCLNESTNEVAGYLWMRRIIMQYKGLSPCLSSTLRSAFARITVLAILELLYHTAKWKGAFPLSCCELRSVRAWIQTWIKQLAIPESPYSRKMQKRIARCIPRIEVFADLN